MNVEDILTELDCVAVDSQVLDDFGPDAGAVLATKRRLAVKHWLEPRLEERGFSTQLHRVVKKPDLAWAFTGGVYTDITGIVGDVGADDLHINSVVVTPGTDAVYLGSWFEPRGVDIVMLEAVNINTLSANSPTYWNGTQWRGFNSLVDHTTQTSSLALSGGGRLLWQLPPDMRRRTVNGSAHYYWVRWTMTRQPSANTQVGQVLPIRESRLTYPTALYTLGTLYAEAAGSQRGEWAEKGNAYMSLAADELQLATRLIQSEFDVDLDQAVDRLEVNSVVQPRRDGHLVERG